MASNYGKDMLRQVEELMKKCDGLSQNMKKIIWIGGKYGRGYTFKRF